MGRLAGHNAVCALLGRDDMIALKIDNYVTCLDLGPWGRSIRKAGIALSSLQGMEAKTIKQTINCQRIYPPRSQDRDELLEAAAPVIQAPPLQTPRSRVSRSVAAHYTTVRGGISGRTGALPTVKRRSSQVSSRSGVLGIST